MKNNVLSRVISLLLCALLTASLCTVTAFAADTSAVVTGGEGGVDGNITWGWTEIDKTLVLSGTGQMNNYTDEAPWKYKSDNIEKITINEGITSIGENAFKGLNHVTEVNIADSVTYIGRYAFSGCDSLETLTLPKNVSTIDVDAFSNTGIVEYNVSAENTTYFSNSGNLYYKDGLDKNVLFKYASGKTAKSFTIPSTTDIISSCAFEGCDTLTTITIPSSVSQILYLAFYKCPNLTKISVKSDNTNFTAKNGVLFKKLSGGKFTLLYYPSGKTETTYTVPEKTTGIGDYAFFDNNQISSIDFGNSVTSIGSRAFTNTALKSIYLSKTLTFLGVNAVGYNTTDNITFTNVSGFKVYYAKNTSAVSCIEQYCSDCGISKEIVKLSSTSISLNAGGTKTVKPNAGFAKSWLSGKKSVAGVKSGKIYALRKGTATITAKLSDGVKITAKVKVKTNPKLSKSSVSVKKGKTASVKITGKSSAISNVYSNTRYAKVTSAKSATTIKVKGLKVGSTTLKIKVNGVTLSLKVKVK